jgi:hypothetical protein
MRGFVDQVSSENISGWVFDPQAASHRIQVRVMLGDEVLVEGIADQPRPDVGKLLGTGGARGFRFSALDLSVQDVARLAVQARAFPGIPWQPVPRRPGLGTAPGQKGGTRKAQITVIGASHVEALRSALPPGQHRIEIINIARMRPGVPRVSPTAWRDAPDSYRHLFRATLHPQGHFVSMLGGNDHNAIGLVEHPQRYGFLEPGETASDLDAGRQLIPYDAMRAMLEERVTPYLQWIADLAPHFMGRKLHLCSPPPIGSIAHIRSFPGSVRTRIGRGVTPAGIRAKLYRINADIFRAGCADLGVDFLPPPAEASDADGFLKPEYWNQDPTHGNSHYGKLLLKQIETHLAV